MERKDKTQTLVISGSASLEKEMKSWFSYWQNRGYRIIDWPASIKAKELNKRWPSVHKNFYKSLEKTKIHFIANEDKNGTVGYIGPGVFAEISFTMGLNLTRKHQIKILLYKAPSKKLFFYKDLNLWLKMGWLEIYSK